MEVDVVGIYFQDFSFPLRVCITLLLLHAKSYFVFLKKRKIRKYEGTNTNHLIHGNDHPEIHPSKQHCAESNIFAAIYQSSQFELLCLHLLEEMVVRGYVWGYGTSTFSLPAQGIEPLRFEFEGNCSSQ